VTRLALDPADPRRVEALIAIERTTPVRADTKVALAFQGLTGLANVALAGGAPDAAAIVAPAGGMPTIYADASGRSRPDPRPPAACWCASPIPA
jgi:phospholipid/cholesterol/gamma-HCH transport system substrate-binding protein